MHPACGGGFGASDGALRKVGGALGHGSNRHGSLCFRCLNLPLCFGITFLSLFIALLPELTETPCHISVFLLRLQHVWTTPRLFSTESQF